MSRVCLTLFAFAVAAPLAAQQPAAQGSALPPARRITLAEALDLAARTQPAMVLAQQNVRVAEAQERQATAAFLPSVTSSASTSRSGGARANQFGSPVTVQGFYSSNLRLAGNLDLFTGFRRGAQRRSASATTDQRDATLVRTQYATILATKQAFFTALGERELVNVAQASLRAAQGQLSLVSERLRLGATTRADSLQAQVQFGTAQLALIQAQADLLTAQANLGRAVGSDELLDPVSDSSFEVRLAHLDTAALRTEALATAPTIREADAAVAATRAQVAVNRSVYWPTVSLGASNTWLAGLQGLKDSSGAFIVSPTGTPFGGAYVSGWNVSLTISLPLFNNLTRETNLTTADANYTSALASARDARLGLDANLTQAITALDAAAAKIDVSRISVDAAAENLRLQQERYRLGASTIFEVLTAQASNDQAQVALVQARYSYLIARAQLEAYVGHGL